MNNEIEVYQVTEFCQRYKISRTSLYKEVNAERLRLVKRGRRTLIARYEADRWFAALSQQPQLPKEIQ